MLKVWVGRQSRLKQWVLEEWLTHSALAEFSLAGQIRDADLIFLKDPGISDIFLVKVLAKKKPKVLLVSEPKVVWPQNYLPFVYNLFDLKVFRCRSEQNLMDDQGEFSTALEALRVLPATKELRNRPIDRIRKAALVNGHKYSWIEGELYTLRRKCIASIRDLDAFGTGWRNSTLNSMMDSSKALIFALAQLQKIHFWQRPLLMSKESRRHVGPEIDDKIGLLERYKVALVIENSMDYMSEKIWDAWHAGCIPVYVGPSLESWSIPNELYIHVRPELQAIEDGIHEALTWNYENFVETLSEWVSTEDFKSSWGYEQTVRELYSKIRAHFQIKK